jgi:hypothetical protein
MKRSRFNEEQIIGVQLEEENRRLKSIVADQALDLRALKDVLAKNGYGPR